MSDNGTTHDTGPIPIVGRRATWADRFPLATPQQRTTLQDLPPVPPRRVTPPPVPSAPRHVPDESSAYAAQDTDLEPVTAEVVEPEPAKTEEADAEIVKDYASEEAPTEMLEFTNSTSPSSVLLEGDHDSSSHDPQEDHTATGELDELSDPSATGDESPDNNPGPVAKLRQVVAQMMPFGRRHKSDATDDESEEDSFGPENWTEDDSSDSDSNRPSTIRFIASAVSLAVFMCIGLVVIALSPFYWWVDSTLAALMILAIATMAWSAWERRQGTNRLHTKVVRAKTLMLRFRWPTIILVSAASGVVMGVWYYYGMSTQNTTKAIVFAIITGLAVGVLAFVCFEQQAKRQVINYPDELVNENMFKHSAERDFWVLTDKEHRIEYWSRPPWVDAFLLCGNGIMLSVVACWAALHFPGVSEIGAVLEQSEWPLRALVLSPLALCIAWSFYSFQEKPIRNQHAEAEPNQQAGTAKPFQLKILGHTYTVPRVYIRFLIVLPLIAAWWWLDWPVVGWAFQQFQEDPYRIAWLVFVPSITWTLARFSYWWGAFLGITNENFWIGSTGYLFERVVQASMDRADLTGTASDQTWPGRIFRYDTVLRETAGQLEAQFQNRRVPHVTKFRQFLGKSRSE